VKRVGKPKDPKTKYVVLPEEAIDEGMRKRMGAQPLHDLAAIGRGDACEGPGGAAPAATAATIDLETAKEIHAELQPLTKVEVDTFFHTFKIARLRELKVADLAAAREHLGRLALSGSDEVPF
jgi:hypothetical protein